MILIYSNALLFILHVIPALAEEKFEKRKPTLTYKNGDSQVFVFDDIIAPSLGQVFQNYLVRVCKYTYTYPDPYENDPVPPNDGNLHWKSYILPHKLIKTRFWKALRDAYKSLPDEIIQGQRFLPYESYGTMLTRGHFPSAFKPEEDPTNKLFMRVFLTRGMSKHSYSDQTFYDENDEIFASVYPRVNRIVIWTGNVNTIFRPPSMGHEGDEYSFFVKLTSDPELFKEAFEIYSAREKARTEYAKKPFPLTNHVNKIDYENFNVSEHVLGTYYDRDGNIVAFFDNVFPKEMIDAVRTYFTHFEGEFGHNEYDTATSETHDNVNWIIQLEPEVVLNTPYFHMIVKLSEFLSNKTTWHPYDVSCNLIQHTHHTRIHLDCNYKEFEYTFLMYMNPHWTENMYAETSFYQYDEDTVKLMKNVGYQRVDDEGTEHYDFVAAAIPKFGRIALFRNLVPHSARPPAPSFLAARYTFPVKVSESLEHARAKMLMELLDYKRPEITEHKDYDNLREGNYSPFLPEEKQDWLNNQIEIMRKSKKQTEHEGIVELEKTLYPQRFRELLH